MPLLVVQDEKEPTNQPTNQPTNITEVLLPQSPLNPHLLQVSRLHRSLPAASLEMSQHEWRACGTSGSALRQDSVLTSDFSRGGKATIPSNQPIHLAIQPTHPCRCSTPPSPHRCSPNAHGAQARRPSVRAGHRPRRAGCRAKKVANLGSTGIGGPQRSRGI